MNYTNKLTMLFPLLQGFYRQTTKFKYNFPTKVAMVDPWTRHTVYSRHLVDELHIHRIQFQIHVIHPGRGNLSRPEIKEELVRKFNVANKQTIFISGFQTKLPFSKGFGIIYDSIEDTLKHEPTNHLAQNGLKSHVVKTTKESTTRAKENLVIKTTNKKKNCKEKHGWGWCFLPTSLRPYIFSHTLNITISYQLSRMYISLHFYMQSNIYLLCISFGKFDI